ncbi:NmrA-like family domain-containing protein 1 [Colletotrichum shisoi]|uniref:NmrA-like family domain-containing protein 1 n=1 Tax=Colletotrichum shisoi TaxID=2078593 RepID=A0A5Q4BB21_9PEZI|nr:NmrA-like family domain-containing protein 1 [Colletotrichum shisoi]
MTTRRIFVIGATGAQGLPVCRGLTNEGGYSLRVLTRDSTSARAQQLAGLGDVEFVKGTFANEADLRKGFAGCWGAFVNIDGFNCGEKAETYWTIRSYELAVELGINFFVFGNLDYGYKKSGYHPKFRCGHYDGKGRMAEWMQQRRKSNVENGVVTWRVPLGDGAVPHVALGDSEHYVRWLFDHPDRSDGMDLEVAIDHIHYADLASAFQKVTGKPAQYIDTPADVYFDHFPISDEPAGYDADRLKKTHGYPNG